LDSRSRCRNPRHRYLRDRRALFEWDPQERFDHVVASILKIRERLGAVLDKLLIESATFEAIQRMQEACRQFLTATEHLVAPCDAQPYHRERQSSSGLLSPLSSRPFERP
jgi:hypothetical protein